YMNLVPTGVGGELYIGGEGVAQGYLNREELTSQRFVENPYDTSERLYRTGDKVRLLPNGDLEYLGRMDDQVKIRGYRIELGEIEHALQQHESITDTVVIARSNEEGVNELVAYMVSRQEETVADLRSFLSQQLPDYMLPSYYVQLDELPLNNNGKVDKKALPNPKELGLDSGTEYIAPETEMERELVEIWQEVLLHERVGIIDDFFHLGGHSLKVVRLINAYQQRFDVKLTLKELFVYTTIRAHSELISRGTKDDFLKISPVEKQLNYALSDAQKRLWVLSQFEEASKAYNMPAHVQLKGEYDSVLFEQAIRATIERHEILRTVFKADHQTEEIRQWIIDSDDVNFKLRSEDFSAQTDKVQRCELLIAEDSFKPFDLENGPLFRVTLMKLDTDEYLCYFNMHHIISDGWSMDVLSKDVFAFYEAFKQNQIPDLPSLPIQYKDYAAWQQNQLDSPSFESHQSFWLKELSGESTRIDLPSSKQRPKLMTNKGAGLQTIIDLRLTDKIKEFASSQDGTLFTTVLALWKALLYRYTAQQNITIGTPVAGRDHIDLENQIGCYVNTLVLNNDMHPHDEFEKFHDQVKNKLHQSFEHAVYPFDRLVDDLKLKRDTSRNAIFDVMLVLQDFEESSVNKESDFASLLDDGEIYEMDNCTSKFDLEITFREESDTLLHQVIYNPDVYDRALMEKLLINFEELLKGVLETPSVRLAEIDVLSSEEREQLLMSFNDTHQTYAPEQTLLDLFEEKVTNSPDTCAISFSESDAKLSYSELDKRSNQLANYLQLDFNIEQGDLIGVKQERSEWMVTSILAILKSGAAYVPIDPSFPEERIAFLENECKCSLGESELNNFKSKQAKFSADAKEIAVLTDNLAYTMYTSGSTGKPKGVQIEHGNLYNYLNWAKSKYLGESDAGNFGLYSSLSFDLTVTSLFLPLISGGTLHIYPTEWEVSDILGHYFDPTTPADNIKLTPAHVQLLAHLDLKETNVKTAVVGGEELRPHHVRILKDLNPRMRIFNEYGPTECTVGCTVSEVGDEDIITIGEPVANTQAYIVNEENSLQPVGVAGELLIGGAQVAQGYLNQEQLTSEKFIENPFVPNSVAYRTGDLAKWDKDGAIIYLGRIDDQIKIRGYRIELGEIEHVLQGHNSITDTVVIARRNENGTNELVAYIVSDQDKTVADMRSFMSKQLPDYMLPSYFVRLDQLPLNKNGKIDKNALPNPKGVSLESGLEYAAPETDLEKQLADVWQKVLQHKRVGVTDDFFHLGGHSLKVIRLINAYQKQFEVKLSLKELFIHTTIQAHSELISRGNAEQFFQISPVEEQESYMLSDTQKRLWVLSQFEEASKAYNMPASVELRGNYDQELFEKAILATVERHEILRTVFKTDEQTSEVRQWIQGTRDIHFKLRYEDFSEFSDKAERAELLMTEDAYRKFDFENGPLFRVSLIKLDAEEYLCYFNMHHIISDGWSMDVLSKDVFAFYEAFKENQAPVLPSLRIQYKDYASWQHEQQKGSSFDAHQSFWMKELSGELPILDLPGNATRPRIFTQNGKRLRTKLDETLSTDLKAFSQERGGTLFMGLLASWNILLHRYTAQNDLIIGTPVAGRSHADLEHQIGAYINSVALRNQIDPSTNFDTFFQTLKENTLNSFEHQVYPFDRLVEELQLERDTSRNPVFDVMLILQNTSESDAELSEEMDSEVIVDDGFTSTKLDLGITCLEEGSGITLTVEYNTDIYDQGMIEMLMRHYKRLLSELIKAPNERIGEIDFLSSGETENLLYPFGNISGVYPAEKSVVDLFEAQVERTPNKAAIKFSEQLQNFHGQEQSIELSYAELNKSANQIARYLQSHFEIEQNDIIAFQLPRNERLIQLIWGILKAGAAYLPLNIDTPEEKIEYIKEDSACKLVINEKLLERIVQESRKLSDVNLERQTRHDSLIYVIYTSGSTGKPKGVLITHENIVAHIHNVKRLYGVSSESRFLQFFNIAFDAAAQEIFTSLSFGATLYLKTEELEPDYIFELINTFGITHADFSTAFFSALMGAFDHEKYPHQLEFCAIGGEKLEMGTLKKQEANIRLFTKAFYNVYGPTETTLIASWFPIIVNGQMTEMGDVIPIGRPYDGRQVVVMNEHQRLQPVGTLGEICIGGDSVARGYLNRPELSDEKFITNPYLVNSRLYRTGDLGKRLPNGHLEFVGRKDDQVKIRGYRIALGEIEHHLLKHPEIDQCVVITKETDDYAKELVAYVASKDEQNTVEL
ncbi:MAG: amino acid adenylation domain-containing protein, partial [Crocinitomicaceae bacterium]